MSDEEKKTQSEGEYLVGITFNPSGSAEVDEIKRMTASLIDYVFANGKDDRCTALAATGFEEAAMWAVKSVTKRPKDS